MQTLVEVADRSARDPGLHHDSTASDVPLIVGLGGTIRANSSSERALAISLHAAEIAGARTMLIGGAKLAVPFYKPDNAGSSAEAAHLVDALRRCDGVIISAAAYHGAISGLLKNAIDYAEDL